MQERTIPAISVVMPAYNAEKYLREAIDSILAQTFTDFEFIIINDGSTDSTMEIIQSYDDPRIVYLENEVNSGICVTLNKGLDAARGRYIARMDSDDISLPHRLATQYAWMEKHPDIAVSGSDVEVFGDGIKPYCFTQQHNADDCSAGLLFSCCFAHPTVIWRKEVISKSGVKYKNEYKGFEDFRLWWDIAHFGRLANIPQPLLRYRKHTNQETKNYSAEDFDKQHRFATDRLEEFGIQASDEQLKAFQLYCSGNFDKFNADLFDAFCDLMLKVLNASQYPVITGRRAIKTTITKSIAYIISQSHSLHGQRMKMLTKAFKKGLILFNWYFKLTYHYLR